MANKFSKNDEAVSAVIGVILMVAITVILAAVIAAFVFGMGSSIKKTYVVSFTIDRTSSGAVVVTNTGGPDVSKLTPQAAVPINVTITGQTKANMDAAIATANGLCHVGDSITITGVASNAHVIVSGTFLDGSSDVLSTADV